MGKVPFSYNDVILLIFYANYLALQSSTDLEHWIYWRLSLTDNAQGVKQAYQTIVKRLVKLWEKVLPDI
tara:strand:- start:290 stop:496 length:207 start_codon:yes stop_codon:yes gene_type:complete